MGVDPLLAHHPSIPFSKSAAVNNAASKARGDVFVIIDADGYLPASVVLLCAKKIREDRERGIRLWFVPYRKFYRLTQNASRRVLESSPSHPYEFTVPPDPQDVLDDHSSGSRLGHWYGALIQIMPREAFECVGGWDPRFRGWGGEDHAAMRAMDTLFWPHKTLPGQVLHLWHPMFNLDKVSAWVHWKYRTWSNQTTTGANDDLSGKYYGATGDEKRMQKLVDEGKKFGEEQHQEIPEEPKKKSLLRRIWEY